MEKTTLRRADLVFSVALILASLGYMLESLRIFFNPFARKWENVPAESVKDAITRWYESPALLPFLVGFLLLVCAVSLLHVARREGARFDFFGAAQLQALVKNREFRSFLVSAALLALYAFALIPLCRRYLNFFPRFRGFPFFAATTAYMLAMMLAFGGRKKGHLAVSILVSTLASLAITWAFGTLAQIPLP